MRYLVLGPLEVSDAGQDRTPTAPRVRTVLALLLARSNQIVLSKDLMTELWGESLPASAANSLQVFVAALRKSLTRNGAPDQALATRPSGYRLTVSSDELDLHRFQRLARDGEAALANGEAAAAAETLREALNLWRGPVFAGIRAGEALRAYAGEVEEHRMRALERRVEADLRLGRHIELVAELEALSARHPLREALHAQLMVALSRSGRRAEALDTYQRLRARLVEELAIEPTPALRRLHQGVLAGDARLDPSPKPAAAAPQGVCAQLPPDVADFTGRDDAVAAIEGPLRVEPDDGRAMPVVVVSGVPGAGKTALAVHCAHRLRRHYPDGQLHLDLHGADECPLAPMAALGRLLRALGVDSSEIPETADERGKLLRTRVADRRMLIVLDNAAGEAQVRPLLPGSPHCGAVVTSRARLPGLEGAAAVDLGTFTADEAVTLLRRTACTERVMADSGGARRIAELCGQLPLAVRVASAKLAAKPHWSVAELADRLADERRRLDELQAGDLDVRVSFAVSYRARPEAERRAFRRLGLVAMPDFPVWAAAAALDVEPSAGEALLEQLVDTQLVQVATRDDHGQLRYQLHDLMRVYAAERALEEESAGARDSAVERVLAAYCDLARSADDALRPGRRAIPDGKPAATWPIPPWLRSAAAADPVRWFAAERHNLVAAARHAHEAGLDSVACALADSLVGFLQLRTHWDDWSAVARIALGAARRSGDRRAEAAALSSLGHLRWDQGRPQEAAPIYHRSLALLDEDRCVGDRANVLVDLAAAHISAGQPEPALACLDQCQAAFGALGDSRGEAFVAHTRGRVCGEQGPHSDAAAAFERAVDLFRRLGDRRWEAYSLARLGSLLRWQGRLDDASARVEESLPVLRSLRDRRWEAYALRVLGGILLDRGRPRQAMSCHRRALEIVRRVDSHFGEAHTLLDLADACREDGRLREAADHLDRSLATFRRLGHRRGEAVALLGRGRLARDQERHEDSLTLLERSLAVFRQSRLRLWEAHALTELGQTLATQGRLAQARRRWEDALARLRHAGSPEAGRVAGLLRGLPGG